MKTVLIVLVIAVVGFLAFVVTRPDTYRVERSRRIDTPAGVIFAHLEDFEPFASIAAASFTLRPEGDQAVTVTWSLDGHNTFVGKVMSVFMNMDRMIGGEFEKGLASLESIAEAEARK
ncbi:MAG: hypothetical protein ACREI6_01745 [Candidatus Rokuibacteriota bacterium]